MVRPRTPIGTYGTISIRRQPSGRYAARTRYRDWDGKSREVQSTATTRPAAERALKKKLADRSLFHPGFTGMSADSAFTALVDYWLEDMELEDRLSRTTRQLYERNMRQLVMPAFEHYSLREITVSRVDRFLKAQAQKSYSMAKQSKTVLSLAFGLAVRYEAIHRNPVRETVRLRKPPSTAMALTVDQVEAIRYAVRSWRRGAGLSGPKPDGQLEAIIEVMLGTSARIGEVLAIRKCDVDMTCSPPTVRLCGTVISPKGKPTYRQDHGKSSKSRRTVAVPSYTAEAVRQRLAIIGDADSEHLIFLSRNHTPLTTNNVRRRLRAILDEAGIGGVTPHSFRRTVATVVDPRAPSDRIAAAQTRHRDLGPSSTTTSAPPKPSQPPPAAT